MIPLVEAGAVTVTRGAARILSNASFSAGAGEFIGVVGPNGAGKSTLLRAVAGIEHPSSGECCLAGAPVGALPHRERARRLAFLPQLREVYWGVTAEAIVALGRYAFGAPDRLGAADRAAVERAIDAADIGALRTRIVTTLSGGEQARVHLARALAAEAPVLVADEPTAALDPKHQLAVMEILAARRANGGLVIAALHDLDLAARFCTRIIVISSGRIVADANPPEALAEDIVETVFGVKTKRLVDEHGVGSLVFSSVAKA
jgi:iron complex transport system ATP-binding protein